MKPEYKTKWIEALRSGRYEQGRGHMEHNGTFCCLGVLRKECLVPCYINGAWLSNTEKETVGLTYDQETVLIRMNDGTRDGKNKQCSFAEIADYIQENL